MAREMPTLQVPSAAFRDGSPQRKGLPCILLATGIDAVGASRLPSLFAAGGYRVALLSSPHISAWRSRYVSRRIACPRGPEAAASALFQHLEEQGAEYQLVVVADEPTLCAALSSHVSHPKHDEWLPILSDQRSLRRILSKIDFLIDIRAAGLPTPRFEVCANSQEVLNAAQSLGFPVFLKGAQGSAGSGLRYARNRIEVETQLSRFSSEEPVVVQEQVEGDTGSTSVFYNHGQLFCWFSYLAHRTWPTAFAASCQVELIDHPDAEFISREVGRLTEFSGLAGIDWIRRKKDGRLVVLEFNPRPTPVYHLGPLVGVNFSDALRALPSNPHVQRPNGATVHRRLFPQNLFFAAEHRNPWDFVATFADAPWDDPMLMLSHLRRVITHYIPESWKNRLKFHS